MSTRGGVKENGNTPGFIEVSFVVRNIHHDDCGNQIHYSVLNCMPSFVVLLRNG